MKLSISNIGWNNENNEEIYKYISNKGYKGLEIAPTMLIKEEPYNKIEELKKTVDNLKDKYGLSISSMQSIWYGKSGNIFNKNDAIEFIDYTKKAIDLANSIGCNNLVFGCPKNRIIPENQKEEDIVYFFKEIGDYAYLKNTVLSLEPNPAIYGTNFINYTNEAFEFVKKVASKGFMVNVDFGTIIANNEDLNVIYNNIHLVNHIHISEPNLNLIEEREEHKKLAEFLKENKYDKFISIEMKNYNDLDSLKKIIDYIYDIFG